MIEPVMPPHESRYAHPARHDGANRQHYQRTEHHPRRLMHSTVPVVIVPVASSRVCRRSCMCVDEVGIRLVFTEKRHEPQAEHIKGGEACGNYAYSPQE